MVQLLCKNLLALLQLVQDVCTLKHTTQSHCRTGTSRTGLHRMRVQFLWSPQPKQVSSGTERDQKRFWTHSGGAASDLLLGVLQSHGVLMDLVCHHHHLQGTEPGLPDLTALDLQVLIVLRVLMDRL